MTDLKKKKLTHIKLTSHPDGSGTRPLPIKWGAADPMERGPVIATVTNSEHRNAIGTHSGSYSVYRALAIAAGALDPVHKPDLTNTAPADPMGPSPAWGAASDIVSIHPLGPIASQGFKPYLHSGYDVRPPIAVTKPHIRMPEFADAMERGRLKPDGRILKANGEALVTRTA